MSSINYQSFCRLHLFVVYLKEHKLRALRFLPDIIKLQRLLMDKFHRRIDRTEAQRMNIREFLRNIPSSKLTVE